MKNTRTTKTLGLASVTLIAAASLTACGGGSSSSAEEYCDIYNSTEDEISNITSQKPGEQIETLKDKIGQLKDAAPNGDVEDAWSTMGDVLSGLPSADEMKDMSSEELQKQASKFKDLAENTDQAQQTIEDYADEHC